MQLTFNYIKAYRSWVIAKPIIIALALVSGAMLWQIYKYTQAIEQETEPTSQQAMDQAQQTEGQEDGLEEVEPELYEKPATLKLDN